MAKKKRAKRPKGSTRNPGSKQAQHMILARRRKLAGMMARGLSLPEAARELGVHRHTAEKDAKEIRNLWLERSADEYDVMVARLLERYERASAAAWEAWETYVNRHGEGHLSAYLDLYIKANDRIKELHGLSDRVAFEERRVTSRGEEQAEVVEIVVESREQLESMQDDHGMITFDQFQRLTGNVEDRA